MFKIEELVNKDIDKIRFSARNDYIRIFPPKCDELPLKTNYWERPRSFGAHYKDLLDRIYNFDVREDDVWIVTFPKSGTTWTQEMFWLILNDFDFDTAKKVELTERSPFLEFIGIVPQSSNTIEMTENLKSPRLIKSHLSAPFLPKQLWTKKPKIVYVARDPKDVAISYFHHWKNMSNFSGKKEDYLETFITDSFPCGPYWDHVLEFWSLKDEPNILFYTYERMKNDLKGVILDCCKFLNKIITEEQISKLLDHLSFDKMKDNPSCNHNAEVKAILGTSEGYKFFRKGKIGSYKEEFPEELVKLYDEWTEKNLKGTNFKFI